MAPPASDARTCTATRRPGAQVIDSTPSTVSRLLGSATTRRPRGRRRGCAAARQVVAHRALADRAQLRILDVLFGGGRNVRVRGGRTDERRIGRHREEPALVPLDRHGEVDHLAVRLDGNHHGRARPPAPLATTAVHSTLLSPPAGVIPASGSSSRDRSSASAARGAPDARGPSEIHAREGLGERARSEVDRRSRAGMRPSVGGGDRRSQPGKSEQRDAAPTSRRGARARHRSARSERPGPDRDPSRALPRRRRPCGRAIKAWPGARLTHDVRRGRGCRDRGSRSPGP